MKRLSSVVCSTWWTIWNLDEQCMSVILSYLELFIHSWGLIELTQGQRFLHVTMLRCSWQFSNSVPLHGSEADTRKTWQWQFHVRYTICTCIVYAFLIIFRWFASPNAIIFMNWSAPSTLLPVSWRRCCWRHPRAASIHGRHLMTSPQPPWRGSEPKWLGQRKLISLAAMFAWKGKGVPKAPKVQLIHVKLQVLMKLQFLPSCTWTQRLQINIHSPKLF